MITSDPGSLDSRWINHTNFFRVYDDGTVKTYFDMMIINGYELTPEMFNTSFLKIEKLYILFRRQATQSYRTKHGNIAGLDEIINKTEYIKNWTKEIINGIMDGMPEVALNEKHIALLP